MTAEEKAKYKESEELKAFFQGLTGLKFKLDCGHHVTFGYFLGNDIVIRNGRTLKIVCLECGR